VYKEDLHWCSVTGFLRGLEVISVLSLKSKEFAYVWCSEGCLFYATFSCWLKYLCQVCSIEAGYSKRTSTGCWYSASWASGGSWWCGT